MPVQSNTTFIIYLPGIIFRAVYLIRKPPRVIDLSVWKLTVTLLPEDNMSPGVIFPQTAPIYLNPTSMKLTPSCEQCFSNCTSNCTKCRSTRCNHIRQVMLEETDFTPCHTEHISNVVSGHGHLQNGINTS